MILYDTMEQLKKRSTGFLKKENFWFSFLKILKIIPHDHSFIIVSNVVYNVF